MMLQEFFDGHAFDAYTYFGCHPIAGPLDEHQGFVFRVFAPHAHGVVLYGDFNRWEGVLMTRLDSGVWVLEVPDARVGALYKYKVMQPDGREVYHADPYGFRMEMPPNTASKVHLPGKGFEWSDDAWMDARSSSMDQPINIYEMHFGSWRHKDNVHERWFNYRELAPLLIPYLKEHGFTHVEVMPLAEHALYASWGYQVSGFYAVTTRYGTPEDLKFFINELHQAGIGVIMDFVPIHFITDDFALRMFDGTPLYEYGSEDIAISEWGTANFNLRKHETRSFLQSNANFWLEEFHFDGLRFDAISNAIYWQGIATRGTNEAALYFLRHMNKGLKERHPTALLIAEDSSAYPKVTGSPDEGGLGFDLKWDLGWMHDTLDYMKLHPDERAHHYHDISFSMMYFYNEHFVLPLSHDEVVHGKATIAQRMWGLYNDKFRQLRTLFTYMFLYPGKKLNFMGNELAHFREWDENKELDWFLLDYPMHQQFNAFFKTVSSLYSNNPVYYRAEMSPDGFQWLEVNSPDLLVYAFMRIDPKTNDRHIVVLNTSGVYHGALPIGVNQDMKVQEILNTDDLRWGGDGETNGSEVIETTDEPFRGHPKSFRIKLSHFAACVFKVTEIKEEPKKDVKKSQTEEAL